MRIGVYSSVKNELDLSATIDYLSKFIIKNKLGEFGVDIYMPALHPVLPGNLQFRLCELKDDLACKVFKSGDINCYNIIEPKLEPDKTIAPWLLDIVLMPLVACDKNGERLGMGGGYYDRTFAFKNMSEKFVDDPFCLQSDGPVLIGCGYDFQYLGEDVELESREWDVKLNGFISPDYVRSWDYHSSPCEKICSKDMSLRAIRRRVWQSFANCNESDSIFFGQKIASKLFLATTVFCHCQVLFYLYLTFLRLK